jgi:hypothetical protein
MIERFYMHTATLLRPREVSDAAYGGANIVWDSVETFRCYYTQLRGDKQIVIGRTAVEASHVIFTHPTIAIAVSDRIIAPDDSLHEIVFIHDTDIDHHQEVYMRQIVSPQSISDMAASITAPAFTALCVHTMDVYTVAIGAQDAYGAPIKTTTLQYTRLPVRRCLLAGRKEIMVGKTTAEVDAVIFSNPLPNLQTNSLINCRNEWYQIVRIDPCSGFKNHWEIWVKAVVQEDTGESGYDSGG